MLSATTQFRLNVPIVNILTKTDIVEKETLTCISEWERDTDILYSALLERKSLYSQLAEKIMIVIKEMESHTPFIPISSKTREGMEDLYTSIQNIFYGGEDLEKS